MSATRTPTDSPPRAGRVRINLLGGFASVRPDGSTADAWQRPSAKKLLCLLLLSPGRRLERSEAGRLLFPALTPARAANGLAKSAFWCRAALGFDRGEALVTRGELLSWETATDTDVDQLLAASRSGELPREIGHLRALADDDRGLLPEWTDDWLARYREEVRHARTAASRELARLLAEVGGRANLDEAVRRWRVLVGDDPLDESRQSGLLRTLLAAGRIPEARAAYTACRQVLWRELAVEPSPELDRLWRQAGVMTTKPPVHAPKEPEAAPPGRAEVMAALTTDLTGAERGQGSGALVVGDAGIGKTAVLRAMADHFRGRGWRVVSATGGPAPGGGYTTLAGALRRLSAGTSQEEFVRRLLVTRHGQLRPVRAETGERALHRRIAHLLEQVSDLPTLLIVDDLHAADPATIRLVRELARMPGARSWSLLAAARPHPPLEWDLPVTPLGPAPDEAIEALVRARCGSRPDAAVRRVVARAGGNPLFARELAALLLAGADPTEVPASAMQLVRSRLARLAAGQRLLIPLVVLAGAQASWPVVHRAAGQLGLDVGDGGTGAPPWLRDDELIVDHDGQLTARHPLVAEAALALLRRGDLAVLHDVLAGIADSDSDQRASVRHRIAAFEAAPTPTRAALALPAACQEAQQALSQGADQEAAGLARCALRAWSTVPPTERERHRTEALDAHLVLGHALAISHPAEAEAAYDNGFRNATSDDDRARFSVAKGWLAYVHGDYGRAAHCYQEGRDLSGLAVPVRAALAVHQGWVYARLGMLDRALELCEDAEALVDPQTHPQIAALIGDRKGMTLVWLDRFQEARTALDRAFELVTRVEDPGLLAAIQIHRGDLAGRLGEFATAERILDDAMTVARSAGDPYAESVSWWARTDTLARMGDRRGALAASQEEERILRLLNNPAHLAACLRRREKLLAAEPA